MKITRLVRSVHNTEKIAIYIDSKYTFSVLESIVISESLYVGKEITKEELRRLEDLAKYKLLKQKLLNVISIRPRSEREIRNYLVKKKAINFTDELIDELKREGIIDDLGFANWWIQQRRTFSKKSIREVQKELFLKGISREIIQQAEIENKDDLVELDSALNLLQKKKGLLVSKNLNEELLNEKLKIFLTRKGFSWEIIHAAFDRLKDETNY